MEDMVEWKYGVTIIDLSTKWRSVVSEESFIFQHIVACIPVAK
jgi:hypothetical protein